MIHFHEFTIFLREEHLFICFFFQLRAFILIIEITQKKNTTMPKNNYCALETKTYKEGCQQFVKTRIYSFLSSVLFELKF